MNSPIAQTIKIHHKKVVFWLTLLVFISSALLYVYYLNATILHIVERKSAERDITQTMVNISELEYEYMALTTEITQERARLLGFAPPQSTVFARRDVHTGLAQLSE